MKDREKWAWYKWFPGKARSSMRWILLTLEEEGYYRRLYDAASLSTPASKRGWLYANGRPMSPEKIHEALLIDNNTGRTLLASLLKRGLITRNRAGAYGFPNFAKHQWHANLRPRREGRKLGHNWATIGPHLGRLRAIEAEAEVQSPEAEAEVQKSTPIGVGKTAVSPPSGQCPHQEIANAWNDLAGEVGLSKVRVPLTEARKRKLKSRWAEWEKISVRNGWQGIWRSIAEGIRESVFLKGDNKQGWKATLDWLIRNSDNWQKILEGQYRGPDPEQKPKPL